MYKNISLTLLLLFLISLSGIAQPTAWIPSVKGSFIWDGNFGISHAPLNYSDKKWQNQSIDSKGGSGIMLDVNGTYMLSDKYGVSFGLGMSKYNSQLSLNAYTDEIAGLMDSDNMVYNLLTDASGVTEEHDVVTIDIPIKFQMYIPLSGKFTFTGGAGLKLNLPVSANYELDQIRITTKAFYPDLNFMLTDYEPMGLYTSKSDWPQSGGLNSKLNVSAVLEAGVALPVSAEFAISCKGYFSHGLSDAIEGNPQTHLVVENGKYNGLNSFLGNARLMQVGIKLGIVFCKGEL